MELWTGFVVGFVGSLHCIGMCGPIAIALSGRRGSHLGFLIKRLLYNIGRTITYSLMGIVAGLIGASVRVAGYQNTLSIALGVLVLLAVLIPSRLTSRLFPLQTWTKMGDKIKALWAKLFGQRSYGSFFLIGILNGFLPCGLVYMALAGAAATGAVTSSILYMFLFGVGTIPVMLATTYLGSFIGLGIRNFVNKLLPVGAIVLAVLLIVRGLSLGIPYLSPRAMMTEVDGDSTVVMECCH